MAEHQLRRSPQPTPQPNHRQSVRARGLGAVVMLADENRETGCMLPKLLNGTPVSIVAEGAKVTMPVADIF